MFHYLFMFLSDFSLGEHFWSVKVPTYAKQMRLGAILNPRASKSTHLNHIFVQGALNGVILQLRGDHPDTDLVATWLRKRSKDAFGSLRVVF